MLSQVPTIIGAGRAGHTGPSENQLTHYRTACKPLCDAVSLQEQPCSALVLVRPQARLARLARELQQALRPLRTPAKLSSLAHTPAQVAILCNHQRSVPKGHVGQMEKMETRLLSVNAELETLTQELNAAKRGRPLSPGGKVANVDVYAPSSLRAVGPKHAHPPRVCTAVAVCREIVA